MSPKKIMIIHSSLMIGGAEKMIAYLANMLSENFETSLLLIEKKEYSFKINKNVKVIQLEYDMSTAMMKMGLLKALKLAKEVCGEINNIVTHKRPDMVIAFDDRVTLFTWLALRKEKVRILFSQRNDPYDKPRRWNLILKYIYHHCDGVVFQLEQVRRYYKVFDKCEVIPNPSYCTTTHRYCDRRKKKVVSAGRLQYRKRFDLLIKAFNEVHMKYPDYELYIYGDGNEKENLQLLIEDLELKGCVFLLGSIKNVMQQNSDAEMFVLSSQAEGIPNILIEAMSAGIPCIATNCTPGGAAFLLNNGENGLLVERNSVESLKEAIIKYIEDKELAKSNALKGFQYLLNFDEKVISERWRSYITQLIGGL